MTAAALEDQGSQDGWQQVRIDFADWHTAEPGSTAEILKLIVS